MAQMKMPCAVGGGGITINDIWFCMKDNTSGTKSDFANPVQVVYAVKRIDQLAIGNWYDMTSDAFAKIEQGESKTYNDGNATDTVSVSADGTTLSWTRTSQAGLMCLIVIC